MDWIAFISFFYIPLTVIYSLLIGSFLNVVIYRLPKMIEQQWLEECHQAFPDNIPAPSEARINLCLPRSHCPECKTTVGAIDNVPVLSWLFLRGKCRHCQTPISKRYPLVECLTMVLATIAAITIPFSGWSVAVLFATYVLIALCFIDFDTMLLPDQLTLPLMWSGIALAVLGISPISLPDAVVGAMAGYLCLWIVFHAFKLITGKEGMGYGDFKLLAALGAWAGWQALPLIIILASVSGCIGGVIQLKQQQQALNNPFSFGPYLAIAGWITLLWGEKILHWYLSFYS